MKRRKRLAVFDGYYVKERINWRLEHSWDKSIIIDLKGIG
jgi:hypothetical protein